MEVSVYAMVINNLKNVIRSQAPDENPNCLSVFDVAPIISIGFSKSQEKVIIDLIKD